MSEEGCATPSLPFLTKSSLGWGEDCGEDCPLIPVKLHADSLRAASLWKWTLPAPAAGGTSVEHFLHPVPPPTVPMQLSSLKPSGWNWWRIPSQPCLTGSCGGTPRARCTRCGTSLYAALVSAKSKLLFCYLEGIKCGEVGVPGRANAFWLRNQLSQIRFHFHCDPERISEMQNPSCLSLSKPERIVLTPAHARSLHSETNLFLPPTGGACVDLAGCLEGPPSPLPFPWRSGTSSLGFFQMNVPLALVRNIRQQGLKLSNCIFFF